MVNRVIQAKRLKMIKALRSKPRSYRMPIREVLKEYTHRAQTLGAVVDTKLNLDFWSKAPLDSPNMPPVVRARLIEKLLDKQLKTTIESLTAHSGKGISYDVINHRSERFEKWNRVDFISEEYIRVSLWSSGSQYAWTESDFYNGTIRRSLVYNDRAMAVRDYKIRRIKWAETASIPKVQSS